jgi:hypothetical protein
MRQICLAALLCFTLMPPAQAARTGICTATSSAAIAALFDRWNVSLQTGRPDQVLANYAEKSVLLADDSTAPHLSPQEKTAYYSHFLERRPKVHIDSHVIDIDCNSAIDAGTYTISYADGARITAGYSFNYQRFGDRWLTISHRHSALSPTKTIASAAAAR